MREPNHELSASVAAKVQRRILPLLMAGWFVAYIDRFNVSFAALQMNQDVGLSPAVFGFGAGLFFLGYSLFEIPSNLVLHRVGARRWLSRIMMSWGLVCIAMVWVQGPTSFNTLRLLLGVAEAGAFPGMAFYLAQWLPARERTDALAKLGSMAFISGMLGSPIAAALLALDGVLGVAGWQWLFFLEGAPALVIGWCVLRYLPDTPSQARWLTDEEKAWLQQQLAERGGSATTWSSIVAVVRDARYWMWSVAFFCFYAGGTALRLWQPIILKNLGQTDTMATLLASISSTIGAISILIGGRHSMRHDERRWHVAVPMIVSGIGLILFGAAGNLVTVLISASIIALGSAAQPPLFSSVSSASTGSTNAVGIAFVNSLAGLGAFLGPTLWGYVLEQTGSLMVGTTVCGTLVIVAAPLVLIARERRWVPVAPISTALDPPVLRAGR
jgi:ACS family tartrate transporter-like MFS transporter